MTILSIPSVILLVLGLALSSCENQIHPKPQVKARLVTLGSFILSENYVSEVPEFQSDDSQFVSALEAYYKIQEKAELEKIILSEERDPYRIEIKTFENKVVSVEITETRPPRWNSNKLIKLIMKLSSDGIPNFEWSEVSF